MAKAMKMWNEIGREYQKASSLRWRDLITNFVKRENYSGIHLKREIKNGSNNRKSSQKWESLKRDIKLNILSLHIIMWESNPFTLFIRRVH
jgi:hypothetical protein